MRSLLRAATTAAVLLTAVTAAASAQMAAREDSSAAAPLDVPYLAQSTLLCGGAAVAMVERWWGRRGVNGVDFAGLIRPELGGIRTDELFAATSARGWDTRSLAGTGESIRASLAARVPVVALIEVGRARYHYVVVIGWSGGQVVHHDPAGNPFTTWSETEFLTRWAAANHWAMTLRPASTVPPALAPAAAAGPPFADSAASDPPAPLPCAPWLDQAVDSVGAGRLDAAAGLLAAAGRACPTEPLVDRELAAIRFKQGRHAEATVLVRKYLARAPDDELGWQLLAASRYLDGDLDGALRAWNRLGRPTVDLIRIDGSRRTRFGVIAAAVSVAPGSVLTPARLQIARRRVGDVPALRRSTVGYQPVAGGLTEVRVAVAEQRTTGPVWRLLAAGAVRAAAQREAGLEVASPIGAGELWSAMWRWQASRPRAAVRLDVPVEIGLPGIVTVEGAWERYRLASAVTGIETEQTRRSAALGFGGWFHPLLHSTAGVRLDRWSGDRSYLAVSVGVALHGWRDRFVGSVLAERGNALSAPASYARGGARASWTSAPGLARAAWSARVGWDWASPLAPTGLWPTAGGNPTWSIPIRADPQTGGGVLDGHNLGRGILHFGVAADRPFYRLGPVVVAAGAFVDGARIAASADGAPGARRYLDGGLGLRVGLAEGQRGTLRIDFARDLLGGRRSALTVGVHSTWPIFPSVLR